MAGSTVVVGALLLLQHVTIIVSWFPSVVTAQVNPNMVPVRAGTTFFAIMPEESYINGESQIPPPTPPPTYAPAAAAADGSSKTTFDIITPEDPAPSIAPLTTMEPTTETTSEAIPPTDEFQVADAVDPNVPIDTVPPDGFVAVAAANPTTAPSVAPGMDLANTTNMTPFGNSSNVTIYMNDAEDDESQSEDEAPGAEAAANAADGSGFSLDKAFQYANVFLVGGHCNIEDDWYTKFVTAGFNTLNATKIICSNEKDEAYTTEFHVNALKQVEEMAGDRLNGTFVCTIYIYIYCIRIVCSNGLSFQAVKEHNPRTCRDCVCTCACALFLINYPGSSNIFFLHIPSCCYCGTQKPWSSRRESAWKPIGAPWRICCGRVWPFFMPRKM